MKLLGSSGTVPSPSTPYHRQKRQITLGVVLLTTLISSVSIIFGSTTTAFVLEKKFDAKLSALQASINQRFSTEDANIRALAEKINAINAANHAQDQAIARSLQDLIKFQALPEETDTFLQSEIDDNQKVLLKALDTYLRSTNIQRTTYLSELELDKLVIKHSKTLDGVLRFNNTKTFLSRITAGNLYLQAVVYSNEILLLE